MTRTDSASKVVHAPARSIYRAWVDADAFVQWLPPQGMKATLHEWDPRPGGRYRMTLTHVDEANAGQGKSSADEDIVDVKFEDLVENERMVQSVVFDADDPKFAGTMTMTWTLRELGDGNTEVSIVARDVPDGIRKEDHDVGLRSTLDNLAKFVE